jgi:hypothetical protein
MKRFAGRVAGMAMAVWVMGSVSAHAEVDAAPIDVRARAIYEELVRVAWDGRNPPDLVIEPMSNGQIAMFDADKRRVVVEPRALAICASFGAESDSAMAALLGHELAHFYLGHAWRPERSLSLKNAAESEGELALEEHDEEQADRQGAYYAYLAGFPTRDILPRLLDKLYKEYGLASAEPGYPSLALRRRLARHITVELEPAFWAFEVGQKMLVLDRPKAAAMAFDRAAQDFPSREVLCAEAQARLLGVVDDCGPEEFPWTLPLLLDPRSRNAGPEQASAHYGLNENVHRQVLGEAERLFRESLMKDPGYVPASIGLASVTLLNGGNVEMPVTEGAGKRDPEERNAYAVLQALECAMRGKKKEALALLNQLGSGEPWAEENLRVLESGEKSEDALRIRDPGEVIGAWNPADPDTLSGASWEEVPVGAPGETGFKLSKATCPGAFALRCSMNGERFACVVTSPGYPGKSARGVALGASENEVLEAYGRPAGVWRIAGGRYLVFQGIAFLERDSKVAEWMLF